MDKRYILAALWLFTTSAYAVVDDIGENISLAKGATRVISLAPDITEILFSIGAGKQIVGVVSASDYPLAAKKIPRVGSYSGIDLERIAALHPDLIVTWSHTFTRQLAPLKKLGIAIYTTEPHRLEDIPRTMLALGDLTNNVKTAQQQAQKFEKDLTNLRLQYRDAHPVSVFYQIGDYGLLTINKASWINQAIALCGGKNIFAEANLSVPEVDLEAVIKANPEVILTDAESKNWHKKWGAWPEMRATKHQFLFALDPDLIDRAGPRLLLGAAKICHFLQMARAQYKT